MKRRNIFNIFPTEFRKCSMYREHTSHIVEEGWPLSLNCHQPFIGYYHGYATSLNKSIEGVKLEVKWFNFFFVILGNFIGFYHECATSLNKSLEVVKVKVNVSTGLYCFSNIFKHFDKIKPFIGFFIINQLKVLNLRYVGNFFFLKFLKVSGL